MRKDAASAVLGAVRGAMRAATRRAGSAVARRAGGAATAASGVLAIALTLALALGGAGAASAVAEPGGSAAARAWQWPVGAPAVVMAEFVAPATKYSAGHRGTDLTAAPGAVVLAPRDGVVAFAGQVAGRPVVSIDHPGDYRSSVEPVVATVAVGDAVVRGQVIGAVASGGHCLSVCVHFGVRLRGEYVNPRGLVGDIPRAVLLPRLASASASAAIHARGWAAW